MTEAVNLLSSEQKAQGCDASKADSSNAVGFIDRKQ
jgi:hypothetical protein